MFAKMLLIIITLGALAATLLVIRQHRIDAAHEMSRIHGRLLEAERRLWDARERVASECTPEDIRLALSQVDGPWVPLEFSPHDIDWGRAALASFRRTADDDLQARH
jgi:hypothetical protein